MCISRRTQSLRNKSNSWLYHTQKIAETFANSNYEPKEIFDVLSKILHRAIFDKKIIQTCPEIEEIEFQNIAENYEVDLSGIELLSEEEIKNIAISDNEFKKLEEEGQRVIEEMSGIKRPIAT